MTARIVPCSFADACFMVTAHHRHQSGNAVQRTARALGPAHCGGVLTVGVEVEERYCELAARRLAQGVLDFGDAS